MHLNLKMLEDHQVLKNGSYLVLKVRDEDNKPMVCKIIHEGNAKLETEINRIRALKQNYAKTGLILADILGQGVITTGFHYDKMYFLQECIEGPTLGQVLRSEDLGNKSPELLSSVVSTLLDTVDEHDFDPEVDGRSGQWLSEHLETSLLRIQGLDYISYLASLDEVIINGRPRKSLSWCLCHIRRSPIFRELDSGPSTIAQLGHWNFHSENIVLTNWPNGPQFRVFDPDVKIDSCDPIFGLARLLYSLPHDTIEHSRYEIISDIFVPTAAAATKFDVKFTWSDEVMANYRPLLVDISAEVPFEPETLDDRFVDPVLRARLDLCILLCLLRGVAANYEQEFWPVNGSLHSFRNNGVFLFLNAIDYANDIIERLNRTHV